LYALVKLVDEAVKLIGSFAKRAQLAFSGDFAGAVAEANRYGSGFMDRFGSNMTAFQRIWSDSASPGTGRRTRGSGIQTTDLNAQREAEREALKAQRDFNQALDDSADLAADLRQRIRDLNLETSAVGQSARQAIETQYQQALNTINDDGERLLKTIKELKAKTGGAIAFEGLANSAGTGLAQQYLNALGAKASKERAAALGDLDREDMLSKISAPAAQDGFRAGIDSYVQSLGTLRDAIRDVTTGGFQYLEDAIVNLTMTGKFQFKDFALSIVSDLTRMVTRMLILAPVMQLIQSLLPGSRMFSGGFLGRSGAIDASGMRSSANFGLGSISGNYFANGGIVNSPTFFRFANGGAGNLGLMGEAGPEGILPLKRGRDGKLGVAGGGGTNITVNVDAKGTSVQGDQAMGGQLARVVAGAVQAELIKQKRPGGMLA
jgi:lambda family phage tail tape measure protein